MKKQILPSLLIILLSIFYGCKKNSSNQISNTNISAVTPGVLSIVKKLGFSTSNVIASKGGFIVEGDIFLPVSSLGDTTQHLSLKIANTEQYSTSYLVTSLPRTIKIAISSLSADWIAGLDTAIARFNNLHLKITFQRVSSGPSDITITAYDDIINEPIATSGFPSSSGVPYPTITINEYNQGLSISQEARVIVHELGHCIGLRHTDYYTNYNCVYHDGSGAGPEGTGSEGAVLIPGTPSQPDYDSYMNACLTSLPFFNANDIIALNYLYGAGTNLPNPFYRYRRATGGSYHFYTTDYRELYGNSSYISEGIQCKIFSKPASGTVPLYRYSTNSNPDHLFQLTNSPITGYTLEGIVGYVYSTNVAGSIALYRFYSLSSGHFFTTSYSEGIGAGLTYEGITCYVLPS